MAQIEETRETYCSTEAFEETEPTHCCHMNSRFTSQYKRQEALVCPKCDRVFKQRKAFELHVKRNHEELIPCQFCSWKFENHEAISQHIKKYHQDKCVSCSICYKNVVNLESHMTKAHKEHGKTKESIECKWCSRVFKNHQSRMKHENQFCHKVIKPHSCQSCPNSFQTLAGLLLHQKKFCKQNLQNSNNDSKITFKNKTSIFDLSIAEL